MFQCHLGKRNIVELPTDLFGFTYIYIHNFIIDSCKSIDDLLIKFAVDTELRGTKQLKLRSKNILIH